MRTPETKEEWDRLIYWQKHKFFLEIADNFPEEAVEILRKDLAMLGEEWWKSWLVENHDNILEFLENMPKICSAPLDYKKNARLYCAALYYFHRALGLIDLLERVRLVKVENYLSFEFYKQLAAAAEAFDLLDYREEVPLWVLPGVSPFQEPR